MTVLEQVDRSVVDCHSLAYTGKDDRVTGEVITWCGVAIASESGADGGRVAADGLPAVWVEGRFRELVVCPECLRQRGEILGRILRNG